MTRLIIGKVPAVSKQLCRPRPTKYSSSSCRPTNTNFMTEKRPKDHDQD